tara:strand:+ start:367 stop:468 length:102 start_codon:yes stop_codon:yes gene_type:complete
MANAVVEATIETYDLGPGPVLLNKIIGLLQKVA